MLKRFSPLRRNTPLRSKSPIKRAFFQRSKRIKNGNLYRAGFVIAPLAKKSKKQQRREKEYAPVQRAFLAKPENRFCFVCLCRSTMMPASDVRGLISEQGPDSAWLYFEKINARLERATEVHHRSGRLGSLLCFVPEFIPSCFGCREWPHTFKNDARKLELLAPKNKFDVVPKEARG